MKQQETVLIYITHKKRSKKCSVICSVPKTNATVIKITPLGYPRED